MLIKIAVNVLKISDSEFIKAKIPHMKFFKQSLMISIKIIKKRVNSPFEKKNLGELGDFRSFFDENLGDFIR